MLAGGLVPTLTLGEQDAPCPVALHMAGGWEASVSPVRGSHLPEHPTTGAGFPERVGRKLPVL